jgi:phage terminase small subunit
MDVNKMPTPRKSLSQLAASGTLGKNLGRYQSRIAAQPNIIRPVGKAPPHLSTGERAVWAELVRAAPPGLLQRSDRLILEVLSRLVVRMRAADPKTSELNALVNVLTKMGLTPVDRTKLNLESPPEPSVKSAEDARWAELEELD